MKARWIVLIIVLLVLAVVGGMCFMCCRNTEFYGPTQQRDQGSGDIVMILNDKMEFEDTGD